MAGAGRHHFNGKRYQNVTRRQDKRSLREVMHWLMLRRPSSWPKRVKIQQKKIPIERVGLGQLRVTFISHSTVLIQMDHLNILTDPIWSKRCGPFWWAGLRRVSLPGVRFEDLPPIDVVLLSHNHYDHMDLPTLKKLYKAHHPRFCVPRGNKKFLESKRLKNIEEFDWWDEASLSKEVQITFVPGEHFSGRGLMDRNKTLWGGYVLKGAGAPVYFAGDTGQGPHFLEINKKFGPMRLSLLPIGSYSPLWFMSSVHMSPDDAVKAHLELESAVSVGIHFGTFRLGDEAIDDPIKGLERALKESGRAQNFFVLAPGEGLDC